MTPELLAEAIHRVMCEKSGRLVGHKPETDLELAKLLLKEIERLTR